MAAPKTIPFGQIDTTMSSPPQTIPFATTPPPDAQIQPNSYGATFQSTGNESLIGGASKLVGNIPSSAYQFGKGALNFLNPLNTVKSLSQIPSEFSHLVQESGGVGQALGATAKELLPSAYGALVPKATQQVISGDFQGARKTLQEDPVGQILPYILGAKAAAEKAGVGSQFDNTISKLAKPVTAPAEAVTNAVKTGVGASTKFAVAQATGLSPETISKVVSDPKAFTREAQATLDRGTLANEVKSALDTKRATLKETGSGYQPIREAPTPIGVGVDWLASTIKETTGLKLKNGQFETSAGSSIRDAKDVRALQNLYDTHKPTFTRGAATTNEFLNLRTDLSGLAKFEREITKSKPLENLSAIIRGKLNTAYRSKIPGLEAVDTQFSSQISELNNLQKGILDKSGNLTDTGINKIANATGKGKDLLLGKLEEITPGITGKIKTLKAIEDIKNAGGQKVGTYARAGGLVGGIATMNPYLIVGSILSIPEIAVPILRGIGMAKPLIDSTLKNLGVAGNTVNDLPTSASSILKKDVTEIKPQLGMSVKASIPEPVKIANKLSAGEYKTIQDYLYEASNSKVSPETYTKLNDILDSHGIEKITDKHPAFSNEQSKIDYLNAITDNYDNPVQPRIPKGQTKGGRYDKKK